MLRQGLHLPLRIGAHSRKCTRFFLVVAATEQYLSIVLKKRKEGEEKGSKKESRKEERRKGERKEREARKKGKRKKVNNLSQKLPKTVLLRTTAHDFLPNLPVTYKIFFQTSRPRNSVVPP